LVVVGIGDVELLVHADDADGVLETNFETFSVHVAKLKQAPAERADERLNQAPAVEFDAPDAARLAVGDEQARAVSSQATRLGERTERAGAVHDVFKSIARPWGELVRLQIERP